MAQMLVKAGKWMAIGVAALVAIALAMMGVAATIRGFKRGGDRLQAMHELEASARELQEKSARDIQSGQLPQGASRLREYSSKLGQIGSSMADHEKKALAVFQRVLAKQALVMQDYENAFRELQNAGMIKGETLVSPEEIQRRKALVQKFRNANAKLAEFMESFVDRVVSELDREEISPKYKAEFLAGVRAQYSACAPLLAGIRKCDDESADGWLEQLSLCDQEWGFWKVSDTKKLIFDHPGVVLAYNKVSKANGEAAARQASFQRQLIALRSSLSPGENTPQPTSPVSSKPIQ